MVCKCCASWPVLVRLGINCIDLMVWVHLLSAVASFVERRAVHCGKLSVVIPVPLLGGPRSQVWVLDWGSITDMENQVLPLERRSGYVRKTPRQAIQALRREIGSRGRDPSQGAVRPPSVPCRALSGRAAEYGLATSFWTISGGPSLLS